MVFRVNSIETTLLVLCMIGIAPYSVFGITYECEIVERYDIQGQRFCVFRDVQYSSNTTDIAFKASDEKHRVVFENSQMQHLPKEFLQKFQDLKILNVTGCNLTSVVITKSMEELIATDNYISKIFVEQHPQNSTLKELHLQSNRISDISNVTSNCKQLRILDLSRNQLLADQSDLDLSKFNGLDQLEYLSLADVGALYLVYDKPVSLPSLTLLDLSLNSLLPVDLRVDYFKSFKRLQVLRLNSNGFSQLDYNYFTQMESLKEVYLEGNEFSCKYLKTMLDHLNNKGKKTPVARPATHCPAGYNIVEQMCCKSESLTNLVIGTRVRTSTTPSSSYVTEPQTLPSVSPAVVTDTTRKPVEMSGKGSAGFLSLNSGIALCGLLVSLSLAQI
nr:carboxypeptidase N subunit 2-like [Aedes albopictus]